MDFDKSVHGRELGIWPHRNKSEQITCTQENVFPQSLFELNGFVSKKEKSHFFFLSKRDARSISDY